MRSRFVTATEIEVAAVAQSEVQKACYKDMWEAMKTTTIHAKQQCQITGGDNMQTETMVVLLWWKIMIYPNKIAPAQGLLPGSLFCTSFMDMKQDMVNAVITNARRMLNKSESMDTKLQAAYIGEHHEAVQRAARQEVEAVMTMTLTELRRRIDTMQEPALVTEAVMAIANISAHTP